MAACFLCINYYLHPSKTFTTGPKKKFKNLKSDFDISSMSSTKVRFKKKTTSQTVTTTD